MFRDPAVRAFLQSRSWQLVHPIDRRAELGTWAYELGAVTIRLARREVDQANRRIDRLAVWLERGGTPVRAMGLTVADAHLRATLEDLIGLLAAHGHQLADPAQAPDAFARLAARMGGRIGHYDRARYE